LTLSIEKESILMFNIYVGRILTKGDGDYVFSPESLKKKNEVPVE